MIGSSAGAGLTKFKWPKVQGKPLSFVAQIDLSSLPKGQLNIELPKSGILYFFLAQSQYITSFDPADKGESQVLFAESVTGLKPAKVPSGVNKKRNGADVDP